MRWPWGVRQKRGKRGRPPKPSYMHLSEVGEWPESNYDFGITGVKSLEGGTVMEAMDRINIPTERKMVGAMRPGIDVQVWPLMPVCHFELRHAEQFAWYECLHCQNAGCPSFDLSGLKEIPAEVWEYMKLHAELCAKLDR